ncbi:MAG: ABC transporter ATP-binding protein [Burkholderiaceae bacterium]|nr:ABC transporter ATP-binding protein [Burkholderiaceae bacterium]
MMAPASLLQVRDLSVSFRISARRVVHAVRQVSFDVPSHTTVALVGESGSGKSVSSLAVMGLLPPDVSIISPASRVLFDGIDLLSLSARARRQIRGKAMTMIFQEPMSSLNPVLTTGFQIMEVLRLHMGMGKRQARERAIALLDEVGIPDPGSRMDYYPHQMSGGQQQRVMIAMAIACAPKLLIADEPTTALDVTIQHQIMELIRSLQERHRMSVLFITHNLKLVAEVADRVIVMRHGEIQEQGSADQVLHAPAHPYTRALLACHPPLVGRPWRLPVIEDVLENEPVSALAPADVRLRGYTEKDAPLLVVNNLQKCFYLRDGLFGRKALPAVKGISFTLPRGKTLGVVGESGSGKTTLGLTLLRIHSPTGGQAVFDGQDIFSMPDAAFMAYKKRMQIVFQNPFASLNPRFTVGQIMTEPMIIHRIGESAQERADEAVEWLRRVGLSPDALSRYPHEFSGGQRQRIAIARCLTLCPDMLVCDESVSALDVSVQAQVLNLLQDLQDELGISYLFISHDLSVVRYMSDRVMVLRHGEVVEMADADMLYREPAHPYTRALLSSIPCGKPV